MRKQYFQHQKLRALPMAALQFEQQIGQQKRNDTLLESLPPHPTSKDLISKIPKT
jgi:hypothetical protein